MKICHIVLIGTFTDGFTYQDNLLPKHHSLLGHEVTVITSQFIFNHNGNIIKDKRKFYYNEFGIKIIRLKTLFNVNSNFKFKIFPNLISEIRKIKPDYIFIHGLQFLDLIRLSSFISKYKIKAVADSHSDFSNTAKNIVSLLILHKIIWKFVITFSQKKLKVIYGVTPSRCEFLINVYKLNPSRIKLLNLGHDDFESTKSVSIAFKNKIKLLRKKFIITTGGKFDSYKSSLINLINAFESINCNDTNLVVFGSIDSRLEKIIKNKFHDNIHYLGWLNSKEITYLFEKTNYIIFTGRHSVLWEQAVAMKKPIMITLNKLHDYLNINNNVRFMNNSSKDEIINALSKYIFNKKSLIEQIENVKKTDSTRFLYSSIAEQTLYDISL